MATQTATGTGDSNPPASSLCPWNGRILHLSEWLWRGQLSTRWGCPRPAPIPDPRLPAIPGGKTARAPWHSGGDCRTSSISRRRDYRPIVGGSLATDKTAWHAPPSERGSVGAKRVSDLSALHLSGATPRRTIPTVGRLPGLSRERRGVGLIGHGGDGRAVDGGVPMERRGAQGYPSGDGRSRLACRHRLTLPALASVQAPWFAPMPRAERWGRFTF